MRDYDNTRQVMQHINQFPARTATESVVARPMSVADHIESQSKRVMAQAAEVGDIVARLGTLADRILGPVPETETGKPSPAPPQNAIASLSDSCDSMNHAIQALRVTVSRLGA